MTFSLTLPLWYDLHAHFRQGEILEPLVAAHKRMGCAGALAMPNTSPPLAQVFKAEETPQASSLESYHALLQRVWPEAEDILVPLYLTSNTTPDMIARGAEKGILRACKYYPPHGTTNAGQAMPLEHYIGNGVLRAMEDHGVVLCVHGEEHGLQGEAYFGRHGNAEESFYRTQMPELVKQFPRLKIVAEHVTTKIAVDFIQRAGPNLGATVTPQHLLYTIGDLLKGLKYHLYCLPLAKFEEDIEALRHVITTPDNTKFFAGTDSAPHATKVTPCGCAAGCFTGGIAPQLYAEAFEKAGVDFASATSQDAFKRFLCLNGPAFYGLPMPTETFTLTKKPQDIGLLDTPLGSITPLPIGLLAQPATKTTLEWKVEI